MACSTPDSRVIDQRRSQSFWDAGPAKIGGIRLASHLPSVADPHASGVAAGGQRGAYVPSAMR